MTCEKIRHKFNIKETGDYHDHYLKKDVLLLADVFEKFIETFLKFHGLDPCHYFSSPELSWDAMLKMTKVKLEKISDYKYLFTEKGIRRGISYIAKRHSKANNKYMRDYDPKKPSTFIIYLDVNNLYGCAMSEYLPYFSNYSKDSKFFDESNKKVIGKMKGEFGGVIVDDFVQLKSKMYSITKIDGKESNTTKGVNIATEFNEFKDKKKIILIKKLLDTK